MEFPLTPHIKKILCGRGMCKDGRLLCSAPNCLFYVEGQPDPEFGCEIEVKGYAYCPRCGKKTSWDDGKEEVGRKTLMKCQTCGKIIPIKSVVWTQRVVSRHKKGHHEYLHGECWDIKFIDVEDDENDI